MRYGVDIILWLRTPDGGYQKGKYWDVNLTEMLRSEYCMRFYDRKLVAAYFIVDEVG